MGRVPNPCRKSWRLRSPKPSHRVLRLLYQRLKRRVAVPPQLEEAGVVFEGLPPRALALVDLGQPEMGRASVEELVDHGPGPWPGVLVTSKLVAELGAGEPLVQLEEARRVGQPVHARIRGPVSRLVRQREGLLPPSAHPRDFRPNEL